MSTTFLNPVLIACSAMRSSGGSPEGVVGGGRKSVGRPPLASRVTGKGCGFQRGRSQGPVQRVGSVHCSLPLPGPDCILPVPRTGRGLRGRALTRRMPLSRPSPCVSLHACGPLPACSSSRAVPAPHRPPRVHPRRRTFRRRASRKRRPVTRRVHHCWSRSNREAQPRQGPAPLPRTRCRGRTTA